MTEMLGRTSSASEAETDLHRLQGKIRSLVDSHEQLVRILMQADQDLKRIRTEMLRIVVTTGAPPQRSNEARRAEAALESAQH